MGLSRMIPSHIWGLCRHSNLNLSGLVMPEDMKFVNKALP